ncbi:putative NADP-dependent glyceraldehyde-3-phosphate dehydrogenase, partial [Burkholderia sp. TJI49]
MSTVLKPIPASSVRHEALRIDGQRVWRDAVIEVRN